MTVGNISTLADPEKDKENNPFPRAIVLGSSKGASGHDNFLKGIIVQFDVKYPQYWTPEAQRYHWLDIVSSQSKMHRLTTAASSDEFYSMFNKYVDKESIERVKSYIDYWNGKGLQTGKIEDKYYYFMKALSNLPMGYEMWETLSTNYLQLKTIYNQRKGHKLKEDWGAFIEMCNNLPEFLTLIGREE